MSRIPAYTAVTLAGLLPAWAAALGLGEIESRSFLNQPLAAEIPVVSDNPAELAGLDVSLASSETFSQYGLTRTSALADLRFAVVPGPGGATIRVTSGQAVTEPFLTMLIEVRWSQGRLLREYTVLLDPPAFATAPARPAVQQPVETPAVAAPAAPIPREPVASAVPAPGARADVVQADAGARTHTVVRNETLWGIAEQYRPGSSTDINSAMVAIYRANPQAFAGNINRLRAGSVLRIPAGAEMQRVGRSEASAEVQRQNQAWRGAPPDVAAEPPAKLELVPPPEPAAAPAPVVPPAPPTAPPSALQADLEESRRLLAIKDAELQALREQVAALERQAAGEEAAPPTAPKAAVEPAVVAPPPEAVEPPAKPEKPARVVPRGADDAGVLGAVTGVLTSIWFWLAAAAVLAAAAFVARRRSAAGQWQPAAVGRAQPVAAGESRGSESMIVVEGPAQSTGAFERRAVPRGEEESPLERTISTEGSVNLDQDDPLAEADFHMAYGLYDQAADLLTAALAREPGRRDLQMKLLDVFFVWENREGFVKQARALRDKVGSDADPDWQRVAMMGRQLCAGEALFAGAGADAALDMDLGGAAGSGAGLDFELAGGDGSLDLDFSDTSSGVDSSASTRVAQPSWSAAQTQEVPTLEVPGIEVSPTMETPTLESTGLSPTVETPTVETPVSERTQETPTLETPAPGGTARLRAVGRGDERSDQTAEIDLDELGLDLAGLDDAARDMATGLQEALSADDLDLDFDLSAGGGGLDGEESTAEMEKGPGLSHITNAMGKSETGSRPAATLADDTVEQPGAGGSLIAPGLSATSDELDALNIDLDFGSAESAQSDLTATGLRTIGAARGLDDATMTEVGTKLDLARAYLDMGDPDGARSILNEVLEEGDPPQRQEARQLLDSLDR
jgi:pilus assembly protein FimV